MNHSVRRSSQQSCNKYLLPNGLWKSPINLTFSWLALKQRSLATARQVPARCWVKLCRDLVTNQIYKLGMCRSVKDTAQAWWLASTWWYRIGYWGFSGFFFNARKQKQLFYMLQQWKPPSENKKEAHVICPLISAVNLSLDYVHVKVF